MSDAKEPESLEPYLAVIQRLKSLEARADHIQRRLDMFEAHFPENTLKILMAFFKAAGDQRHGGNGSFGVEFFNPETDDITNTLRITLISDELNVFAYAGPEQWVPYDAVQPHSLIWNLAVDFLKEHQLVDAHVKLVSLTYSSEESEVPHEQV